MHLTIDRTLCSGHARCHSAAPDLFPVDDDGYSALTDMTAVSADDLEAARCGVAACPERALRLIDA